MVGPPQRAINSPLMVPLNVWVEELRSQKWAGGVVAVRTQALPIGQARVVLDTDIVRGPCRSSDALRCQFNFV